MIDRHRLEEAIHYIPGSHVLYLQNAKVACSTIKKSLWASLSDHPYDPARGPHERRNSPFCWKLEHIQKWMAEIAESFTFTVVRNPYVRILSSYLDKIAATHRDIAVWHLFAQRHRLSDGDRLSFREFLERVTGDDPELVDQHFRPQVHNILYRYVDIDYIGALEDFGAVQAVLGDKGVVFGHHSPHATGAARLLDEFYGEDEARLVRAYFAEDFEAFGYSESLGEIAPVAEARMPRNPRSLLGLLPSVFVAPSAAERAACADEIAKVVPSFSRDYALLSSGVVDKAGLVLIREAAIRGQRFENWKFLTVLARNLLDADLVFEANSVVHMAKVAKHGA